MLAQLYYKIYSKPMPRYSVPQPNLKEYTTTKADKKKNIYKIPEEAHRIPDKEEAKVETPTEEVKGGDASFEENKSRSKTIYQRDSKAKPVSLADFKLIKKIGKGAFGTVNLFGVYSVNIGLYG